MRVCVLQRNYPLLMKPEGMLNECVSMCWPTVVMCLCMGEKEGVSMYKRREVCMCDFVWMLCVCECVEVWRE